ncbi:hypothetical protein UlMin_033193 [Ulmus minor]
MEELKSNPANSFPLTPLGFLDRAATVYGDCTSVVYNSTSFTWAQTHRRILRLASSIVSLGIKKRQVVSVVAPNIPAMYELQFAVPMAGTVLNTINTRLDPRTVSVMLRHSESKLIFVDQFSTSLILDAISLFPPETPVPLLVLIADNETDLKASPAVNGPFCCNYENLIERGDPEFKWVRPESEWDPMILNYTSGTTSSPKGVVHCHRGLFTITLDSLVDWAIPKHPVYLWTLPMFHANGWSFPWGMAAVGGTNICLRKFDAETVLNLIGKHGVTHMCAAPVVLNMLSNFPNNEPLKHPVNILTGGAPPAAAVLNRTESMGFIVKHGYGMTETAGVVISCSWKPHWNRFPLAERARLKERQGVRTAGMTEVDVVDPKTGTSVKRDGSTMGEIVLRGACLLLGYFKDPEATAKFIRDDGWFYTGDLAVIYPDGYIAIKDRSKDIIISGGENISSVQVELMLYSHPAINEASVVARPDERWGETPCAFVSLKKELTRKPTAKEIIDFCREKLPHYMVPKTVVFKDELPKTATGKIQKFVLKEIAKAIGYDYEASRSRM